MSPAYYPGVPGPVVKPLSAAGTSVGAVSVAPLPARPGATWLRHFRHHQALVSSAVGNLGPQLYPLQQPCGNQGRAPGPQRTGRITCGPGFIPFPGTTATSPPIQPGPVWRRYFQHPQQTTVVAAPPYTPSHAPIRNPTFGAVHRVSRDGDTMSGPLVNTRSITAGVAVLKDAAVIAVDASAGLHFRVTLGGDRTLGNPVNATDGQKITFELIQDSTGSRTLALGSAYAVTSLPSLTSTAGKRDFLGFIYSATTGLWYPAGLAEGF